MPPPLSMDEEECPERRFTYTRESLDRFRMELQLQQERERNARAGGFGGFGSGGTGGDSGTSAGATAAIATTSTAPATSSIANAGASSTQTASNDEELSLGEEPSPLEQQLSTAWRAGLVFERDSLLKNINDLIDTFDRDLKELHRVQCATELRIKSAEYKHVLFYQELVHLRVFDKREERLEERRQQKRDELKQNISALKTANTRLTVAQKDVTRFSAQEKAVHSHFNSLMADNNKVEKVLTKIFKKKVVRSKKGADGESDSGSDSEDMDDVDGDDEDFDASDEDDEIDENICPPGCDQAVYEKV